MKSPTMRFSHMRNIIVIAILVIPLAKGLQAQGDTTDLFKSCMLMNRDTFYSLRLSAFQYVDSCLISKAQNGQKLPTNLPELFVVHPTDSLFSLYSYRFRHHSALHSYRGILIGQNKVIILKQDSVQTGDVSKNRVYSKNDWYGAIYYELLEKKVKGQSYYFVFGFRDFNAFENQKLLDALWFDADGNFRLGAALFELPDFEDANRYFFDYGEMGAAKFNYDPYAKLIMKDHLILSTINGRPVMLPDGSYEAMDWKKNKWSYIEKVYEEVLEEAPRPVPLERDNRDLFGNEIQK